MFFNSVYMERFVDHWEIWMWVDIIDDGDMDALFLRGVV